jgi:outer membrane protein insertion porin family/translocation and assembly module TamA
MTRVFLLSTVLACIACREEAVLRLDRLSFDGVDKINEAQLRQVLATKQGSRLPFSRKPAFIQRQFDDDLKRIKAFYNDHGYPDAQVASVDIALNDKKDAARVTVRVIEGEPITVADVRMIGFDVLPRRRQQFVRNTVGLRPGDVRDRQRVVEARETAVNELKEHGYPYATVDTREDPGEAPRTVVLTYQAVPGKLATFGDVEIQGTQSVGENVVRRQLVFNPGDPFRLSRLQESQRRLQSMELFSFAYVEPRIEDTRPPSVPVRVTVAEGKHQRITFGVGYGTEEKARARAEWRDVNFLGGARTASLQSKWSSLDRGVKLAFAEPHFLTRHLTFSAEAQGWDEQEPVYRVRRYGGRGTIAWQRLRPSRVSGRGSSTSAGVTFINEFTDYSVSDIALNDPSFTSLLIALGLNPETGASRGALVALRLEAQRNTAGTLLDPRRGYVLRTSFERAGGFLPGKFTYDEFTAEARQYQRLPGGWMIASRARLGGIDAPAPVDASVPFYKRYFLGGSTSLRGWGRYEVSPATSTGILIGGLSVAELSTELRIPVTDKIGAVAFLDAGNVWSKSWDIKLNDLRADVGAGLRYATPIGPVRADLGYQLTPIDDLIVNGQPKTRQWRVHFSIGQAF